MASASHPKVIIYTTPTCPDCWALKAWLEREGIAFEERDLSDPKIMAEAKARTGVRVAPITILKATLEQPIHGNFGARSGRDLYLVDRFEGLAQRHFNLTFTPVLSDAPGRIH